MKLNKILALFAACALAIAPSCSDDDGPGTPLSATTGENSGLTHNTLTFDWEKVEGATQYGYELYDNNDNLVTRDVTEKTKIKFDSLKPATEYTLKVWAYAAIGSGHTSSEPIVLKATTSALKVLGTPTVEYTSQSGKYKFSWKSIANADAYSYTLLDAAGEIVDSGSTSSRSVSFSDLEVGDYTFTLKATTTVDGYEPESDTATVTFTAEEVFVWKAQGTYKSAILGKSWEATIVYYGDNNYTLKDWYGVEGYNLTFYIDNSDPEDTFGLSGNYDYDNSSYTYAVPTGRTDLEKVWIYPWWNYCTLKGNQAAGSLTLYVWNTSSGTYVNDVFTWEGEMSGAPADDFAGKWYESLTGSTYITDSGDLEAYDYPDFEVEFTKVDDYTIAMPALYFTDETMNAKINLADMTITADPLTVWTWYTLAGSESDSSPVIGKILEDGSIEFTDWNAWYSGWVYFENQVAKFHR